VFIYIYNVRTRNCSVVKGKLNYAARRVRIVRARGCVEWAARAFKTKNVFEFIVVVVGRFRFRRRTYITSRRYAEVIYTDSERASNPAKLFFVRDEHKKIAVIFPFEEPVGRKTRKIFVTTRTYIYTYIFVIIIYTVEEPKYNPGSRYSFSPPSSLFAAE